MSRPVFHASPQKNWLNDPNGVVYFHGMYHMYYQHYPHDCAWGTMHWGHLTSRDLVTWEEREIALRPTRYFDRDGCFSGSAIEMDGELKVYYTGVRYVHPNPEHPHLPLNDELVSEQVLVTSRDGFRFDEETKQVVVPRIDDISLGSYNRTRDPRVWRENGNLLMIVGSQYLDAESRMVGSVLLYRSQDGVHWDFARRFSDPGLGSMWECPILFELNSQHLLAASVMKYRTMGESAYTDQAVIRPVDFDSDSCAVTNPGEVMLIDLGGDFYAPHLFQDGEDQPVIIGWLRMPQPLEGEEWIGMMTLPRRLSWKDGQLYSQAVPSVTQRFSKEIGPEEWDGRSPLRIQVEFAGSGSVSVGGYQITVTEHDIRFDRSARFPAQLREERWTRAAAEREGGACRLDIYVDHGVAETYIDGGRQVVSHVLYGEMDDAALMVRQAKALTVSAAE